MNRREAYINKIETAYHEYLAASIAIELLEIRLRADPSFFTGRELRSRIARELRENLEGTYLIRLFAVFEAGLRDAWLNNWHRNKEPPVSTLIDAIATKRIIKEDWVDWVHKIRDHRNGLIHQDAAGVEPITIEESQKYLRAYFSSLPKDW